MAQLDAPVVDRIARFVFRTLASLPLRVQRRLGGAPIRIDGQELNATAQLGLSLLRKLVNDTYEKKPISEGRRELAREASIFGDKPFVAVIKELSIEGPHGPIPVRLYQPAQATVDSPLVVFFHGGGWVLWGFESADSVVRHLANRTGFSFLPVDYRLAPEYKFPIGVEDSQCVFDYSVEHAKELRCDPSLVGVAGESAGGNISAVISQMTAQRRRAGERTPSPALQVLFQPVTDLSRKHPSYQLFSSGFFLTEAQMDWYKYHYLRTSKDGYDQRAPPPTSPYRASTRSAMRAKPTPHG